MLKVKRTTIEIPQDTLIKIKSLAVKEGTTQNKIINKLIDKGLKTTEKNKKKAKLINDELPKLKGEAEDLEDLAGFVDLDHKTNAVDLKNAIHTDKARF